MLKNCSAIYCNIRVYLCSCYFLYTFLHIIILDSLYFIFCSFGSSSKHRVHRGWPLGTAQRNRVFVRFIRSFRHSLDGTRKPARGIGYTEERLLPCHEGWTGSKSRIDWPLKPIGYTECAESKIYPRLL